MRGHKQEGEILTTYDELGNKELLIKVLVL